MYAAGTVGSRWRGLDSATTCRAHSPDTFTRALQHYCCLRELNTFGTASQDHNHIPRAYPQHGHLRCCLPRTLHTRRTAARARGAAPPLPPHLYPPPPPCPPTTTTRTLPCILPTRMHPGALSACGPSSGTVNPAAPNPPSYVPFGLAALPAMNALNFITWPTTA